MSTPTPPATSPSSAAADLLENAHRALGKAHALLGRCHAAATRAALRDSQHAIRGALEQHGISFEGKRLLVALTPTLLAAAELERLASRAALVRAALLEVIERFTREHHAGQLEGPLHRYFRPYARWWDLIAAERRRSEAIQLMRYDAIREEGGSWRLLETNTCCPGGVIHCARVRAAWLASPLGRAAAGDVELAERPIDHPDGFLRHLHELASQARATRSPGAPGAPVVAICSYRGSYQNEVASLAAEQRRLVESGELAGSELAIGDAREVECDGAGATLRGRRINVLYNKLDPLAIDPGDPELAGWALAAASPHVELVNSLAAMYLTETKRVLALLRDERLRGELALDAATRAAIDELVPR
jgi:diaminobutyrate-2-oxoglutarate transaminase